MSKLVSAIITTHNRKDLLLKAINSVLNQTYKNIECIVVDDASTDATQEILSDLIQQQKVRYIYIAPENSRGGNHARNVGVQNARGEYLAFLDDDDEWLPEKTEKQVAVLENNADVGFVFCGRLIEKNFDVSSRVSDGVKTKDGDLSKEILIRITTTTTCIMVRKDILLQAGGFDEELKYWQEYEMTIRVLQLTKAVGIKEDLVLYRVITGDTGRLSNKIEGWEQAVDYINQKHKLLFATLNEYEEALRQVYVCIDGFSRAKKAGSIKYMCKYVWRVLLNKNMRNIVIEKFVKRNEK